MKSFEFETGMHKGRNVDQKELSKLGLTNQGLGLVETIEDLRPNPPNIVIAEAARETIKRK